MMSGQTQPNDNDKENKECFVLDASFFIEIPEALEFLNNSECYTTPSIYEELKSLKAKAMFDAIKPKLNSPREDYIKKVKEVVKATNDKLSPQDIEVLALALMLKDKRKNVILLTEDYGIMNVASCLSLRTKCFVNKGIKDFYVWRKRCAICGRLVKKFISECPYCGSKKFCYVPKRHKS